MVIAILGVPIAVEIILAAAIAAAVALWYVAQILRNSGGDWVGFVEDVRWGAHQWIDSVIGWIRDQAFGLGNAVLDGLHNAINWAADQARRGGDILHNWGDTLAGWADQLQWRANEARQGYAAFANWILNSHRVQTTDMPLDGTGDVMAPATFTNIRVGQVETYADGKVADLRTYTDSRDGQIEAWTTGEVASVRGWAEVRFGQFDTWVTGELITARQYVDAQVLDAKAFASAVAALAVAPVLEWISGWQALLEWLRAVFPEIAAFLANPWAWLFARAGSTLWYLVELWLKRVWDGDAYLPDP